MLNKECFAIAYRRNVHRACEAYPDVYAMTIKTGIDIVVDRMLAAFERGSANKDSHACRWTCKELGIKHTYKAIKAYLDCEEAVQ